MGGFMWDNGEQHPNQPSNRLMDAAAVVARAKELDAPAEAGVCCHGESRVMGRPPCGAPATHRTTHCGGRHYCAAHAPEDAELL